MGILGKDLFDFGRTHTNTKVQFDEPSYRVESNREPQPYSTVLTDILNLDITVSGCSRHPGKIVESKDNQAVPRAFMDLLKAFFSLPLYCLYLEDFQFLGGLQVEELVVGEAQETFAESVIDEAYRLPDKMRQCLEDIRFIQQRYSWFLNSSLRARCLKRKRARGKNLWPSKSRIIFWNPLSAA